MFRMTRDAANQYLPTHSNDSANTSGIQRRRHSSYDCSRTDRSGSEEKVEIQPVTLAGRYVRLEPLDLNHVSDLAIAARDNSIWRYMPYASIETEEQMRAFVTMQLSRQADGSELAFAVVLQSNGKAIGNTRFLDIRPEHRSLEIGGTWYGVEHQRTAANTESKYLLLCHAFDQLGCLRVQFKTDLRNERSQRAIQRIGAVREGVLRKHMIMPNGHQRHTVMFSIIDDEWPLVKGQLEGLMVRP
jgi:RimJ/RimL family protein N-acetyltransferase